MVIYYFLIWPRKRPYRPPNEICISCVALPLLHFTSHTIFNSLIAAVSSVCHLTQLLLLTSSIAGQGRQIPGEKACERYLVDMWIWIERNADGPSLMPEGTIPVRGQSYFYQVSVGGSVFLYLSIDEKRPETGFLNESVLFDSLTKLAVDRVLTKFWFMISYLLFLRISSAIYRSGDRGRGPSTFGGLIA